MQPRCVSLKLLLDELGVSDTIQTVDDRKRVQKAVYLGQRAGVNLGYRFGWYLMGPYSPSLARDYFDLADSMKVGDRPDRSRELVAPARQRLDRIKPLMNCPADVPLEQEDWLELVASVDYLQKVRHLTRAQAEQELVKAKPTLAPYFDSAFNALKQNSLQ